MSEWVSPDITCSNCSKKGPHLSVDGMLYCGVCDEKIRDEFDPDELGGR